MNAVTGKIEQQVKAGRQAADRTFHLVENQLRPVMGTRRAQVATGLILASIVVMGVGMIMYRSRRHPTLASRIEKVLPAELRPRAIKRALG